VVLEARRADFRSHIIEPQETERKKRLDGLVDAMRQIAREPAESPELLRDAPHDRPVHRLDEVRAVKQPVVRYRFDDHPDLAAEGPAEPRAIEAQKGA
jgi:glycine cleavage system protein P-like pyridoxal-binding family